MHRHKIGRAPAGLQFHPRADDDGHHLHDNGYQRDQPRDHLGNFAFAVLVVTRKVFDVFEQAEGQVSDGAKAKEDGTHPDEGRGVAALIGGGRAGTREAVDQVEEDNDRERKHVKVDSIQHSKVAHFGLRIVAVGLQALLRRDELGGQRHDVDGEEQEAVEDGEGAEHSLHHGGGVPRNLERSI